MEKEYQQKIEAVTMALTFAFDEFAKNHNGKYPEFSENKGEAITQLNEFISTTDRKFPRFRISISDQGLAYAKVLQIALEIIAQNKQNEGNNTNG